MFSPFQNLSSNLQSGSTAKEAERERLTCPEDELIYPHTRQHPIHTSHVELVVRFLCFAIFIFGIVALYASQRTSGLSDNECARQLSVWSPVLDAVEYQTRDWTSSLSNPTEYTGPLTAELEERWDNISNVPVVLIPSPKIPLLNRSTSQGFISNPSGSGYIAGIEVFHHLHCLNMLRQAIARDLYPPNLLPSMFRNSSPAVIEKHVGHCVETLRQALMCTADVTPYLVFEGNVGEGRKDREDFEASHKCRNFGGIRGWMLENGIPVPEGVGD